MPVQARARVLEAEVQVLRGRAALATVSLFGRSELLTPVLGASVAEGFEGLEKLNEDLIEEALKYSDAMEHNGIYEAEHLKILTTYLESFLHLFGLFRISTMVLNTFGEQISLFHPLLDIDNQKIIKQLSDYVY